MTVLQSRGFRFGLVLVLVLVIQTTWVSDFAPFGVPFDLLLTLTIAGGLAAGPVRGATIGFAAGMALDLVLISPLGLTALAYLVVGYVVGSVHDGVIRAAPWIPVAIAAVATIGGLGFLIVLAQLMGQQYRIPGLAVVFAVNTVVNVALVIPGLRAMRWVEKAAPDRMMAGFR